MKTPALTLLLTIAALAPRPAAADDLAVDMTLELGRSRAPVFILEAESLVGGELEGVVRWTVNGMPIDESSSSRIDGRLFEIKLLPLSEASQVCAEFNGRLGFGGDLGRDVEEEACALWLPSDAPLEALAGDSRLRESRVGIGPQPLDRSLLRR